MADKTNFLIFNISGSTAVKLLDQADYHNVANSISIANIHTTDIAAVDLYLKKISDSTDDYIMKNVKIPFGVTLMLEGDECDFPLDEYKLYIKLAGGSSTVDVIIR